MFSLLALSLPFLLMAQNNASMQSNTENENGIQWVTGLSWDQIKQKAKAENKYIFVDAYTTWCGPCKMMDRDVYTNDTVANYFKDKFISLKVQMDKTKEDNKQVQSWYKDAAKINETYHVEGYPTFLFLNPDGILADHQIGYKGVNELLAIAQNAMLPGKVYNDPYSEYDKLIKFYKQGEKDYNKYPLMITMANRVHDDSICHQLLKEFTDYVLTLKPSERFTKDRIQMWAGFTFRSDSRVFQFFYKDGKLIDKVMNQKGYANAIVDKTIWAEDVLPFLIEQAKGSKITVTGGYITDVSGKGLLRTDSSEADWKKLYLILSKKFGKSIAERNVIAGKIEWYTRHWNHEAVGKYKLRQMDRYWTEEDAKRNLVAINNDAFNFFMHSMFLRFTQGRR